MNNARCMDFLRESLPAADFIDYGPALFSRFVDHALHLRATAPHCAALEEELFLHYVLCPRVNDEDLSFHRRIFYDALWPRIHALSQEEAIQAVNRWCCEEASYEAQDERTASPLTVLRSGSGRCGEESAFLVSALRSVGFAARQVYAPRWSHCDDNHAWVEVLCHGTWRFFGACEPEPLLDRGWFNTAAGRAVLVHSRLFGRGTHPLHGAELGSRAGTTFYNQTARYAPVKEFTFRALLRGAPAPGAELTLHVLNEAHFFPIAHLTADERGEAKTLLGRGDIWVSATQGTLRTEGLCPMEGDGLTLELTWGLSPAQWQALDFHAPAAVASPPPLTDAQKERRKAVLAHCATLRRAKMACWYQGDDPLLRAARGNAGEISAFLERDDNPLRRRLVEALSPKDLRDVRADALEGFLRAAAPYAHQYPAHCFDPFLLCPRVALEGLEQKSVSPEIAAVRAARARGVPARLRPLDGGVEYWEAGAFRPQEQKETALLRLSGDLPGASWSLARLEEDGWRRLHPQGSECALTAGFYRLITSVRLPSGDQLARKCEFKTVSNETVSLPLTLREVALEQLLFTRALPPLPAEGVANTLDLLPSPTLLFWLEEGGEPTEHILCELMAAKALPPVAFFLRGPEALRQSTLAHTLVKHPEIRVFYDDWAYDLEQLSRLLGTDPECPPLAMVWDGKAARYARAGYHVGSVELLSRMAARL